MENESYYYSPMASSSVNDPSQGNSYQENFSCSESNSEGSATEEESDSDAAGTREDQEEPCRYYNSGHCRDGKRCHYLHVCKYALRGNCRYGAKCRLKHLSSSSDRDGGSGRRERRRSLSGGRRGGGGRERRRSSSGGAQRDISGPYKWQLEDGHGWTDIANDHILEGQYSQPNIKGINIYNTPYGKVSIDFKAMRVRGKNNLRVRRLDGQQTEWIWFYSTRKGWTKYGEKDSKGNPGPIQSSEIEKKFQRNRNGSLTFNIGSDIFKIRFRQMRQVSSKRKRKVVRRPKYQPPQSGNLIVGQSESPEWQFGGKSGRWHTFKDSADIEDQYQKDFNGSMSFTVNGQAYKLDFSAMKQTNQSTSVTRNIRRVKRCHYVGLAIVIWQVYIDFDQIEAQNAAMSVRRLTFLPQAQSEDIGWYFKDDLIWREYGSLGPGQGSSSVSSGDVERQYILRPQGTFHFTVGSTSYTLDFTAMTQTNAATRVQRNVRRRPKFNSVVSGNGSVSIAQSAPTVIASPPPYAGYTWEFMGKEGVWIEYQTPSCSLGSAGIERRYQKNPKGQIRFKAGRYSYTLDFSGMCQTNVRIGTKRIVRRTQCEAQQTSSGGLGLQSRWQFQDVDGSWKDFAKRSDTCSVSSQDIEAQYQQNPNGTMNFTTRRFSYQLDFSALTQRNLSTQTTRSVRRLN
ncbi:protein mono-ADP-ribosyltransferase PARP12 [Oncorhynchus masou masou]|uniref:protein mono-ADP-ribosyltransferase PARP12 n=1 Tax=Oncorhynchus masou masou TaxID=90313 RepID=UPI003183B9F8